jgi:hypothetical protein
VRVPLKLSALRRVTSTNKEQASKIECNNNLEEKIEDEFEDRDKCYKG